jgi:hypothetical protein
LDQACQETLASSYPLYTTIPYSVEIITRMYFTTMIIGFTVLSRPGKVERPAENLEAEKGK